MKIIKTEIKEKEILRKEFMDVVLKLNGKDRIWVWSTLNDNGYKFVHKEIHDEMLKTLSGALDRLQEVIKERDGLSKH